MLRVNVLGGIGLLSCGVALMLGGCEKTGPAGGQAETTPDAATTTVASTNVDDGGWWCKEHGVPEEICARCSSTIAAEFQEKNDWCDEHNRPESQCFICHPDLEAKFAAQYEAKFGQKPPKPTE